ncbi:cysteine dioxygenase family protein [Nocardioides sp. LHD-245]|uniref:cysteine dioxygenase family protein n=1 Tax=Nocardioides sp. LHD-245 TaxID=3051387 RepID=UPI0027E05B5E|nr:cysteine dioxygenase family protein [Nocardioides sp. LHD-245]
MDPHLANFISQMNGLVENSQDPAHIATETAEYLSELLRHPEFLDERYRQPDPERYRQHVVHVHEEGLYSIVSLVWKPGQETPIHDHRCWCVVGVLQGRELETRYELHTEGDRRVLVEAHNVHYSPGQVCALVPPDEDIHKVANDSDDAETLTISMHIYGANIAELGTSINEIFTEPLVASAAGGSAPLSWRGDH